MHFQKFYQDCFFRERKRKECIAEITANKFAALFSSFHPRVFRGGLAGKARDAENPLFKSNLRPHSFRPSRREKHFASRENGAACLAIFILLFFSASPVGNRRTDGFAPISLPKKGGPGQIELRDYSPGKYIFVYRLFYFLLRLLQCNTFYETVYKTKYVKKCSTKYVEKCKQVS